MAWLKHIARLPLTAGGWVGHHHTFQNDAQWSVFSENCSMSAILLRTPHPMDSDQRCCLETHSGRVINFYELLPIYKEEAELAMKQGANALLARIPAKALAKPLHINRPNYVE